MEIPIVYIILFIQIKITLGQYVYNPLQFTPQGNTFYYPSMFPAQNIRKNVPQVQKKTIKRQNTPKSKVPPPLLEQNAPIVSPPRNIQSPPTPIYKRWGPKFVIVENNNKHSIMDKPQMKLDSNMKNQVGHNTKILQYSLDSAPNPFTQKKNYKYENTQTNMAAFMANPLITQKPSKRTKTSKTRKPIVNQRLLQTKAELSRPLPSLSVPEHYKRFTAMRYKKKPISNMYKELIESDEHAGSRSSIELVDNIKKDPNGGESNTNKISTRENVLNKQEMIMRELLKEKEELVRNYFGVKKPDDEEIYRKVTGKSNLLGFVYNPKNNTIEHERSDEPQYKTSIAPKYYQENTPPQISNNLVSKLTLNPNNIFSPVDEKITFESQPSRKTTGDTKSTVIKEHITKQLLLEENMKHGEQIAEENDFKLDKKRPKLELGEDLHGVKNRFIGTESSSDPIYPLNKAYAKVDSQSESFDSLGKITEPESTTRDAVKILNQKAKMNPSITAQQSVLTGSKTRKGSGATMTGSSQETSNTRPKIKDDFPTEKVVKNRNSAVHQASESTKALPETPVAVSNSIKNLGGSQTSQNSGNKSSFQKQQNLRQPNLKPNANSAINQGRYNTDQSIKSDDQIHENERPDTNPQGTAITNRLPQESTLNEDANDKPLSTLNRNLSTITPVLPDPSPLLPNSKHTGYYPNGLKEPHLGGRVFDGDAPTITPPPGSININSLYVYNVKGKDNSIKLGLKHEIDEESSSLAQKVAEVTSIPKLLRTNNPVNVNEDERLASNDNNSNNIKDTNNENSKNSKPSSTPNFENTKNFGASETAEPVNNNAAGIVAKPVKQPQKIPIRNKQGIIAKIKLVEPNSSPKLNNSNEQTPKPNLNTGAKLTPENNINSKKLKDKGKLLSHYKRPAAQPCKDNECEADLMKDMKYKFGLLYDKLFLRGANHMLQVYSTGCKKLDCSVASSSIKFDGMELSGKSTGFNVVVLTYPGFEFLYSKTYDTGNDPNESKKMVEFFRHLLPPYIIMIATQGEVFSSLLPVAWQQMGLLTGDENLMKTPGSSLAFIGYRGDDVLPWQQLNQGLPGHGASASFAILGSDNEYITFGGTGVTMEEYIKELRAEEDNDADTRDTAAIRPKYTPITAEPSLILTSIKPKTNLFENKIPKLIEDNLSIGPMNIHSEYVQTPAITPAETPVENTGATVAPNNPMLEAEGDNEPQVLSNEKLKKLGDFYTAHVPQKHLINESRDEALTHGDTLMHGITEEDKSFEAGLGPETSEEKLTNSFTLQKNKHLKATVKDETYPTIKSFDDQNGEIPSPQAFHPDIGNTKTLSLGLAGSYSGGKAQVEATAGPKESSNKAKDDDDETYITKEMSRKLKEGEEREKLKDGFSINDKKLRDDSEGAVANQQFGNNNNEVAIEGKGDSLPMFPNAEASPPTNSDSNQKTSDQSQTLGEKALKMPSKQMPKETNNINFASQDMVESDKNKDQTEMEEPIKKPTEQPGDKNKDQADEIKKLMQKQKALLEKEKDVSPEDAAKNLNPSVVANNNNDEMHSTNIVSPGEKDPNLPGMAYNEHRLAMPNFHDSHAPHINAGVNPIHPSLNQPEIIGNNPHAQPIIHTANKNIPDFVGHLVDTGHLNPLPMTTSDIYKPHPLGVTGPFGEHLYTSHHPSAVPMEDLTVTAPHLRPHVPIDPHEPIVNSHHPLHTEHNIPVYNGPHPYMLSANTPIEPPEKFPNRVDENPKPGKSADSELQSPEFQKKLKEMLAEELTKKLSELKISPEKRVKTESYSQALRKTPLVSNKQKIQQEETHEIKKLPSNVGYEDENATSVREELFIEGDEGDFDDKDKINVSNANRDTMKEGEENKSIDADNKTLIDKSNNYFDVKIEDKSETAENSKSKDENNIIGKFSPKINKSGKIQASSTAPKGQSTVYDIDIDKNNSDEERHKYDRDNANSSDKEENDVKSKYDREQSISLHQNKDSKIQKSDKQTKEPASNKDENAKKYTDSANSDSENYVDFASMNANLSKTTGISENSGSRMDKEEQSIERENKHIEEALHKELKNERPKQLNELKKLVDDQEVFLGDSKSTGSSLTDSEQKEIGKPMEQFQNLADQSLVANESYTNGNGCKRYKILKYDKHGKSQTKKTCVERESPRKLNKTKPKMRAMPDAQESVGALSLNPGYSTLPGAEARAPGSHEVSYYFDNSKLSHNLANFRDNVYGDATSSNIYDQADYTNVAERLLQKDVQDTFSAANDIMTAQEVIDKAKNIKKKGKISKIKDTKHGQTKGVMNVTSGVPGKKRTNYKKVIGHVTAQKNKKRVQKGAKKTNIKVLDTELLKSSFRWK